LNVDSDERGGGEGRVRGVSFDGGSLGEGRAEVENVQSEEGDDLREEGGEKVSSRKEKKEEKRVVEKKKKKKNSREATST